MSFLTLLGAATAAPDASWDAQVLAGFQESARAFHATDDALVAQATGFQVHLSDETLWAETDQDVIGLRLAGWGRSVVESVEPAAPTLGSCVPGVDGIDGCVRRVELQRDGLTEYWQSTRAGVEQGWEIDERLPGGGPLALEVALDAAAWFVDADGAEIHGWGGDVWRYDGLAAWDAEGEPLAAWMEATDDGLRLVVDDADAAYPILVDPTIILAGIYYTDDPYQGDKFGYSVSNAGDVNGDGFGDIVVGAISDGGNATNSGTAYVWHGSEDGLEVLPTLRLMASEGTIDARFGHSVSTAGDMNGDGYDDVVVSAVLSGDDGAVYVFFGSEEGLVLESETVLDGATGERMGDQVAYAGDVNGDGLGDIVVGQTGANQAWLYLGDADGVGDRKRLEGPELEVDENSRFGRTVDGAGDLDGDGYDDIVVGAWGFGELHVFMGGPSGASGEADRVITGDVDEKFGYFVAGLGDVNGDGFDDVGVNSPTASTGGKDAGAVSIFLGSESGLESDPAWVLEAQDAADGWDFGWSFDGAGDIDGDGIDDIVVGAPGAKVDGSTAGGALYIYGGSRNGVDPTSETRWDAYTDSGYRLGESVAKAGDINGDGLADVVAGSAQAKVGDETEAGTITVLYGCPDDDCTGTGNTAQGDGTSPWAPDDYPGCGCASTTGTSAGVFALVLLALVTRRRRG